jgi:hypothetical protein
MDAVAGRSDQPGLFAVSWLLVWAVAIRSRAIIGKKETITETASGGRALYEQC